MTVLDTKCAEQIMKNYNSIRSFREKICKAVIIENSIFPVFQPIIDLISGSISSFEVLARWTDSEFGSVSPTEFIPMIDQAGLLDQMTDQLIMKACSYATAWGGEFRLTFNITPSQFVDPNLVERIINISSITGFSAQRLQVEIVESVMSDEIDQVVRNVEAFRVAGIRIILDDFGTGFSNLARLHSINFDKIKIDASFVKELETRKDSRKISSAVIGLGHSLGMSIVAEGIENEKQLLILKKLGCDYGQGYLFSKPVTHDKVLDILKERGQAAHEPKPIEMSCNRKIAELDTIYETDEISICFIDIAYRVVSASKAFCRIIGVSDKDIFGKKVASIFDHNVESLNKIIEFAINNKQFTAVRSPIVTKNGILIVSLKAIRDEGNQLIGVSLFIHANSNLEINI